MPEKKEAAPDAASILIKQTERRNVFYGRCASSTLHTFGGSEIGIL